MISIVFIHISMMEFWWSFLKFHLDPRSQKRRESLLTNENLYGNGHSIFYPASQSGKPAILDFLMKEKAARRLLQRELQHSESETFILGVCQWKPCWNCTRICKSEVWKIKRESRRWCGNMLCNTIIITINTCMQQPLTYIVSTWSIYNYANTERRIVLHVML
jgi:hypothetical protein